MTNITKMEFRHHKIMIQKAIKRILVSIALISILLALPINTKAIEAGFSPPEDYMQQESLPFLKDKKESPTNEEQRLEDLFGSEQVFPFEAGLEKSFD